MPRLYHFGFLVFINLISSPSILTFSLLKFETIASEADPGVTIISVVLEPLALIFAKASCPGVSINVIFLLLLLIFIITISLFNNGTTSAEGPKNYLKGKFYSSVKDHFLIATEKMKDNRFSETVIVMFESDENGAWGLVINKRLGTMPIALLIDPFLNSSEEREKLFKINISVFWGGPVDVKEIFILHSTEYQSETTKNYGNISISKDYNILFDIAENKGPEKSLVILGYSGWGSGQLEGEMERADWILSDLDLDIIFEKDSKKKWKDALKRSFIKI